MVVQVAVSVARSSCSSAVFLPSAAVRTITPKFLGLMASISFCKRFLSSPECILRDTATTSLNGVNTTKRPGSEISQLNRGPFAAIGSFKICTNTEGFPFITSLIFPVFSISGSTVNLLKSSPFSLLSFMENWVNLRSDLM